MREGGSPSVKKIHQGECCWEVVADRAGEFERVVLPTLEQGHCTVIKSNRHRTLLYLPACRLFVKHHHLRRWTYRLRQRLEGSRGKREWRSLLALRELGLAVPAPVAWGSRTGSPDSFFVSARIEGASSLLRCLETVSARPVRHSLLASLARQLASVHRAGWKLPDLHGENLLVAGRRLYFVDFHSARRTLPGVGRRVNSWGNLLASIGHLLAHEERDLLLSSYLQHFPLGDGTRFRVRVEKAEVARLRRRYRKAIRRCRPLVEEIPGSSGTRIYRAGGEEFPVERLVAAGAAPEQVLKTAPRAQVTVHRFDDRLLVQKAYYPGGLKHNLRSWLGTSRAEEAFRTLAALEACRFAVPRGVACLAGGSRPDSVWTRFLPEAVPLDRLLDRDWGKLSGCQKRLLAEGVGTLVGRLHRLGIHHPDLTLKNFLVRLERVPQLWLVDVDGVRLPFRLSRYIRILNLAQLYDLDFAPGQSPLRAFLRSYLRESGSRWVAGKFGKVIRESKLRQRRARLRAIPAGVTSSG